MKNRERRKARLNKGDKYSEMRALGVGALPAEFKARTGGKFADPEDILQGQTNDLLKAIGQYHFRLSANLLAKAGDASVGGWPDNPMLIRLAPGLFLGGPLELKRSGHDLRANQEEMRLRIGTVMADRFEPAEAYVYWFRDMAERFRAWLRDNPPPPLPKGIEI